MKSNNAPTLKNSSCEGYSIIELITVVAGLTLIAAVTSSTLQNIFRQNQVDTIQAHLNNAGNECLKALRDLPAPQSSQSLTDYKSNVELELSLANNSSSPNNLLNKNFPYLIETIDDQLLQSNGYKINPTYSTCMTLQLDPIDPNSTSHPTLGFGIYRNKLTKIGSTSGKHSDALSACKAWASSYCSTNQNIDHKPYYDHMWQVTYSKSICEKNFEQSISNNTTLSTHVRWDSDTDNLCNKLIPDANGNTNYKLCTISRCTKQAWALDGQFIGYSQTSYNQAQSLACDKEIQNYIASGSYNGESEIKTDFKNCTTPAYICNYNLMNDKDNYDTCNRERMISKCNADLERIRTDPITDTNVGPHVVGSGTLRGLPPCGQEVYVYNGVIHYSPKSK